MTTNNGAGGLVAKWRAEADAIRGSGMWDSADMADRMVRMCDELEAALQAPAGGAVAWLYRYPHDGESDHCISPVRFLPSWVSAKNATETPLFTTPPPDDVLRRVVEALAKALKKIVEAANESDSHQYGTLGTAYVRNIAAPALAAHKALAEGVDRGS